jgi:hypothetical protein
MFPWQDILAFILSRMVDVYFDPAFWIVLALVGFQYRQMQRSQQKMFGAKIYSLRHQILLAAFYGSLGGIVGSFLLTAMGVTLNQLGFNYIWPLALILMMIHVRFLCFAYAGGLVALSRVLFGWPEVNVPQILTLVAILHVTESLLIAIGGRYGALPMFLRREDGRLVGAFSLQNFWPVPLVLLMATAVPGSDTAMPGTVDMPDWWPVLPLGLDLPEGQRWLYGMMPVVAALGYADMAITGTPQKRRMASALHLALYSMVLLFLSLLSARYTWLQVVAALASPMGHELLIQWDNRCESEGPALFVPPARGVMVLDTVLDSPARAGGVRTGDIIHTLNGMTVQNGAELAVAIACAPQRATLDVERSGKTAERTVQFGGTERRLGVILVPEGHEQYYAVMAQEKFALVSWLKRLFRK